ncbi:MAG TPA: hypothetical protein PLH91_06505 [Tenuifilaceae bacterium]|nr:hypothetical protein [Tenuifilaceae bacterium]HPI44862.1 hypothetical protein [Tenuifilaceae bacterium]HPN22922.1 hypothetical protein [Tenuifilaceae bacterium]HPV56943.1 hypothetical protein [Tenuifilaceae bacterium]
MSQITKDITSLFIKHPDVFKTFISNHYSFTSHQLSKYRDFLDWHKISENPNINWNGEILQKFKNNLDWHYLSTNPSVFKDLSLIDKFLPLIVWENTDNCSHSTIASNDGICWNMALINKYKKLWDYKQMSSNESIPWTENLIDLFVNEWDWFKMSGNNKLPWSNAFIEKHFQRLEKDSFWFITNKGLTGKVEIVDKYHELLEWDSICRNSNLPWYSMNLLKRWEDHISWFGIAGNELLFSDPEFLENNLDKWLNPNNHALFAFSYNKALPWSIEFINIFLELWDWEHLSLNTGLPWSKEFIDHFEDKFIWGGITVEFEINEKGNRIEHHTFNQGLISNEAIPWSIDFINNYKNQIDYNMITYNDSVWYKAFKPYVDEKLIDTVIRII